jgi:hypothetical protein
MKTIRHFTENTFNLKKVVFFVSLLFTASFFCQTPNLGATRTFAIFSAAGAIDNVGASKITGDVGTNVGAFNGFPPGTIDGNIHVADAVSAQAAIDVDLLYTYFVGLSCDSTISSTLGNNQNLVANTYCISTASSLNDTLILDGQNNSSAQFIFKINGAFTTSVYSTILLINQALAKNVYWQVNGLFNLGDNSQFKGTMITDGANSLLTNSSVEGRILSRAGAISLASNAVVMNFNDSPLPIELLTFKAQCLNNKALLKWQTASELNNDYFTLEKSFDNQKWTFIAKINAAGNSTSLQNYSFLMNNEESNKLTYFRLKQTDFDGHYSYSSKIILENCVKSPLTFELYPNPSNGTHYFNYSGDLSEFVSLKIVNAIGEDFKKFTCFQSEINLRNYPAGAYFFSNSIQR